MEVADVELVRNNLKTLVNIGVNDNINENDKYYNDVDSFMKVFNNYLFHKNDKIEWNKIKTPENLTFYDFINNPKKQNINHLLNKIAIVKLNGGLGTTMGCSGPKSAIEVTSGMSFLDLTIKQINTLNHKYSSNVPLVLMNSFNTDSKTSQIISKYKDLVDIYCFNQSKFPRILKETLTPLPEKSDGNNEWYPPGHGDFYQSFYHSDTFRILKSKGIKYLFVSNIDNLGATIDLKILNYQIDKKMDFIIEVTDKTLSDVKGGTIINYDNRFKLLELAQVPEDKIDEFKSIKKFKIFNTNNIWVSVDAVDKMVNHKFCDKMDVIVNNKNYNGDTIVQFETAIGSAIQCFPNSSMGINVPRSRFLPVKSTCDLFCVQSNLYSINEDFELISKRINPGLPVVKFGTEFKKVDDYKKRFVNIPNVLELDHLTVSGDVFFGKNVILKGTVIIVAHYGSRIDIPEGTVLENKVVSGDLRILDH